MKERVSPEDSTEESVSLLSLEESTEENVSSDGCTDGSDIRSALDLCRLVEANRPKIEMLDIGFMSIDRAVWAGFEVMDVDSIAIAEFSFELNDQPAFRQIGQVLGKCSTLRFLRVYDQIGNGDHNISLASVQCITALYDGLKESKSVRHLRTFFDPSNEVPAFDLDYFRQQNQCLESLEVHSSGVLPLLPEQCNTIASAVENTPSLTELNMWPYMFKNNGSYEDILSKCFRLKSLYLDCEEQYQFDALATLLRDPRCEIRSLRTNFVITDWDNNMIELIENILCDTSSIEAIEKSNHTLECFDAGILVNTRFVDKCLELNKNQDKEQVIREKSNYLIEEKNVEIEELMTLVDEMNAEIEIKDKLIDEKDTEIERKDKLIEEMTAKIERLTSIQDDVDAPGSEDFSFISSS